MLRIIYVQIGLSNMKRTLYFLFSLWTSICSCSLIVAQDQFQSESIFVFDFKIEYAYTTPTVPNGRIIALYNSRDRYVMYSNVYPFMDDDSQLLVFFDGSAILFTQIEGRSNAFIYPATIPGRNNLNDSSKSNPFWDKVKPTERKADIAGYEAAEYQGKLSDDSKRTIWISEESFDSRALHAPLHPSVNFLPLMLTEALYIQDDQFLLSSEIALENGHKYFLTVTYLEYELKKVVYNNYTAQVSKQEFSMAQNYQHSKTLLWQDKYEAWIQYDRFNGLEYTPRTYDFDTKVSYEYSIQDEKGLIDVFFNSEFEFCGIRSELFSDDLKFVLGFKDGTVIAYYSNPESLEAIGEGIFFDPAGGKMHLDHPDKIQFNKWKFDSTWNPLNQPEKNDANLSSRLYDYTNKDYHEKKLGLSQISFDPRTLYLDYASSVNGFIDFQTNLDMLPVDHLITLHHESEAPNESRTLRLKSYNRLDQKFEFSDEQVALFYRIVMR